MNIPITLLNASQDTRNVAEEFVRQDPYGLAMAAIAMVTVITVLALVAIFFHNIENMINLFKKPFTRKEKSKTQAVAQEKVKSSGEEMAAIALALHLYQNDLHDHESLTLTMNKISRRYSPWSSKIYGMMNKF
ncbi:MAG: OadG family protein [Bacteroidales bacterium]|nr:OadG family protein [Bacteroidales bacterium]MDD4671671.1 OadG family protein [Bacteroidales bacterium]MDY0347800.1 OadG family protein [Tenuifilaceae bacterium]